jgi:cell wall-associated NlpC family hydrolase
MVGTVVALTAGVVLSAAPTDAARRTSSSAIADEAGRALIALDRWEQSQHPVDYVRFVQHREQTAAMTAAALEADADELSADWAEVSTEKQHAVLAAMSQLGVPYRYLGSEPGSGFDCSGLTSWAFGRAGVELPRVSRDQINDAEEVEREDAEAGDLLYWPGHVGIYLGAGTYVHSPNAGNDVEAVQLPDRSLRFGDPVD